MISYTFTARGHLHIRATHPTTLEFTRDTQLTTRGNCIAGVGADFAAGKLKGFFTQKLVRILIQAGDAQDAVAARPNPLFSDGHELVIRTTDFRSARTFATGATKAARDLSRSLVERLKDPNATITVTIEAADG